MYFIGISKLPAEQRCPTLDVNTIIPQANGEVERQNRSLLKATRIAQATGKDWHKELNKFLLAYRSIPHTITGDNPTKLLFGRDVLTKIRCLEHRQIKDTEIADRDLLRKQKEKTYVDEARLAEDSLIERGDVGSVKNNKPNNKLSWTFGDKLYQVMDKQGNEITVESSDGATYRRNSSHVEKYRKGDEQEQEEFVTENSDNVEEVIQRKNDTGMNRPRRERRLPERFDEYLL